MFDSSGLKMADDKNKGCLSEKRSGDGIHCVRRALNKRTIKEIK